MTRSVVLGHISLRARIVDVVNGERIGGLILGSAGLCSTIDGLEVAVE
jgi:hypothetical protein